MTRVLIGVCGVVLATQMLVAGGQRPADEERRLKAAMNTELVDGNLKTAIEQYKTLARSRTRGIAARALVRLAECHRKLGNADARAIYERVAREFGDQVESATTARTQLAALARPGDGTSGIEPRRVWEDAARVDAERSAAISPDGRYLVYPGGGGPAGRSDLYVRDFSTGLNRRLTPESATNLTDRPVFSPDGKLVALGFDDGVRTRIRLVALDGSAPRVLTRTDEWGVLTPKDWSADGKQILALGIRKAGTFPYPPSQAGRDIVLVSVADGSVRFLKAIKGRPYAMSWSRDGRYVVYDNPARGDSGEHDIFVFSTDGGQEAPLVTRASEERYPFFTPDGGGVVFLSTEGGSVGAWYQRLVDGKPQGSPALVRPNMGSAVPTGFASNGSFYYSVQEDPRRLIFVATLDATTGAVLVPPFAVTQRPAILPLWSPDGRSLAYASGGGPVFRLMIRSTVTGEEREFAPPLDKLGNLQPEPIGWSADSRFILGWGTEKGKPVTMFRVDVRTGDMALRPLGNATGERWFPNQESVVQITRADGKPRIVARDLESGRDTELYTPPASIALGSTFAVSANSRHVAFGVRNTETRTTSVMVMPVSGEKPREVGPPVALPDVVADIWALTPDGRYVLYTTSNQESGARKLWRIAVDGGAPQEIRLPIDLATVPGTQVSLHPDGQQIAFISQVPGKNSIWALDNLVPRVGAAR